ncbi:autophagy protein Apg6 [Trichodelitschia bisporula]|uniref:Autophagy protein Apg6 n=1 Tax=Trichodelitschia bisporula TaxID=703511 RepID=A0A6G1HXR1_9PEZI|nr:autophagy protein Apg6 [Trichodelitschia bisporula]
MYCQKCRTPLKLDGSLEELNPAAFKLLTDSAGSSPHQSTFERHSYSTERREEYERVAQNARLPAIKRNINSNRHATRPVPVAGSARDNPAMSFVMLTESQVVQDQDSRAEPTSNAPDLARKRSQRKPDQDTGPENQLSNKMETTTRLFEILSARSDIDHPICVECTELLVESLQKRLSNSTKERDAYVEFLRQANADIPSEEELQQAKTLLEETQAKEKAAFAELKQLEAEKAKMEEEILSLEAQSLELDEQEEEFWAERNDFATKLSGFQNERERINKRYENDFKQLERLRRANVYNDTFSIGHDGFFGTINGLRLGRLPDKPVEWAEINAAWGHTCLLLATVAEKLNFTFKGYELVPMGSTSKIRHYQSSRTPVSNDPSHQPKLICKEYDLFSSGEFSLGINIFNRKFDTAMVYFLECLSQLLSHARRTPLQGADGNTVEFPHVRYEIDRDKIGDHSIKLGTLNLNNQEESWTKACKSMLTCCKYLLAYTSNVSEVRRRP